MLFKIGVIWSWSFDVTGYSLSASEKPSNGVFITETFNTQSVLGVTGNSHWFKTDAKTLKKFLSA